MDHRRPARQTEGAAGLGLALVHGQDTGADDLRDVGARVDTKSNGRDDDIGYAAEQRQLIKDTEIEDEIDDHQLDDRWSPADDRYVPIGETRHHFADPDHHRITGQAVHVLQLGDG